MRRKYPTMARVYLRQRNAPVIYLTGQLAYGPGGMVIAGLDGVPVQQTQHELQAEIEHGLANAAPLNVLNTDGDRVLLPAEVVSTVVFPTKDEAIEVPPGLFWGKRMTVRALTEGDVAELGALALPEGRGVNEFGVVEGEDMAAVVLVVLDLADGTVYWANPAQPAIDKLVTAARLLAEAQVLFDHECVDVAERKQQADDADMLQRALRPVRSKRRESNDEDALQHLLTEEGNVAEAIAMGGHEYVEAFLANSGTGGTVQVRTAMGVVGTITGYNDTDRRFEIEPDAENLATVYVPVENIEAVLDWEHTDPAIDGLTAAGQEAAS